MNQYLTAVYSLPTKRMIGKHVIGIPAHLDRQKIIHAALMQNLRQRSAESEYVGQMCRRRFPAELFPPKALAVENLPHQRFARSQIEIAFRPHGALQFDTPFRDLPFQLFVQDGIAFLYPTELLRLTGAEDIIRIPFEKSHRRRKSSQRLAFRLADRPQPPQIQMRVTRRIKREPRIGAFFLQLLCEEFARLFQFPIVVKIQHAIDFAERQQNLRIASRILVEDGQ